ncbi:MAG: helix-turn-helix transcriptional regulator [Acidobacteria bacterium]|nr:helix-turn-helix transcriptional regulator [Acidobacteriota bacterium]
MTGAIALCAFAQRLSEELLARKHANPRYSLRAFAALLGTDHAVISQILRGRRRPPTARIQEWAKRLGIDREQALAYVTEAHVPGPEVLRRQEELRHWAAEALSVVTGDLHFEILQLTRQEGFQPDCRWIAQRSGHPVDAVNMAISRLLRLRLLEMAGGRWRDLTQPPVRNLREFRQVAAARVRQMH